jgi:hypothetical protein
MFRQIALGVSAGTIVILLSLLGVASTEKRSRRIFAVALAVLGVATVSVQTWQGVKFPVLKVAEALNVQEEEKSFRLPVANEGDAVNLDFTIVWLKGGEQVHDDLMPMKLGQVYVSRKDGPVMVRLIFVNKDARPPILSVNAPRPRDMVIYSSRKKDEILPASFCVRVSAVGADAVEERAFQLVPDRSKAVLYRPEFLGRSCSSLRALRALRGAGFQHHSRPLRHLTSRNRQPTRNRREPAAGQC